MYVSEKLLSSGRWTLIFFSNIALEHFTRTITAQEKEDLCEEIQLAKMYTTGKYYLPKGSRTLVTKLVKKNKFSTAEAFAASIAFNLFY